MMDIVLKGADFLEKWADKKNQEWGKALQDALKTTAFQTQKLMKEELKSGNLNLKPTTRSKMNPKKSRNPLSKFAFALLYRVDKQNLRATIGFHGDTPRTSWVRDWASEHQHGYPLRYTDRLKAYLHKKGIHIKKATQIASVPARDIIGSFFSKHQRLAIDKLKENFRLKLRGEWIK